MVALVYYCTNMDAISKISFSSALFVSDLVRNPEDRFSQDATRMYFDKSTEYAMIQRFHYANMPMEYTAIFHGCKSDNFQMKNVIL